MSKFQIIKDYLYFLNKNKKWWLTPIIIMFLLLGLLIILTQGSVLAPFIYTIF